MARRVLALVFAGLSIAATGLIIATLSDLPLRVATHFGSGGMPQRWMARENYVFSMLLSVTVFPLLIVILLGWLPRVAPRTISLPHRAYWLDPVRRDETMVALGAFACALGALVIGFVSGIHLLIVTANAGTPARLPEGAFWSVLVTFAIAVFAWIGTLHYRFRAMK